MDNDSEGVLGGRAGMEMESTAASVLKRSACSDSSSGVPDAALNGDGDSDCDIARCDNGGGDSVSGDACVYDCGSDADKVDDCIAGDRPTLGISGESVRVLFNSTPSPADVIEMVSDGNTDGDSNDAMPAYVACAGVATTAQCGRRGGDSVGVATAVTARILSVGMGDIGQNDDSAANSCCRCT